MKHELTIERLQELCTQSVTISYNADAADVLSMQMKPEAYTELGFSYGDRLTLTEGERVVFSGVLASGAGYSAQAGSGEVVSVEACSDFNLLERTAYCKLDSEGMAMYPSVGRDSKFARLGRFLQGVFNYAKGWSGTSIESSFRCSVGRSVPVPEGNGTTTCGALMTEAMRWTPDVIMLQRYSAEGNTIEVLGVDEMPHLTLEPTALLTNVNLQARPELVPPVCALVGGDNYIVPRDGDVRVPGTFVYPVPVWKDDNSRAGSAPNSQKMTIKGIAVPERTVGKNCAAVYDSTAILEDSRMHKFLRYFFPAYRDVLLHCSAGAPLLNVVPVEDLQEDEPGEDEDSIDPPANYSDPLGWGGGDGYDNCYVLTEGSFTASSRSTKNLRGLRWCKATISLNLSISQEQFKGLPPILKPGIDELFPGRNRRLNKKLIEYDSHKLVNLKLDCVLVNARKRIFDPATNQPCSTDSEYDSSTELTITDYRAALDDYYTASRTVWHEGSIDMLHDGSLQPELLTGNTVTIQGKRAEWNSMNAIIRSVTWNYKERTLSLNVGAREASGFSEILERRLLSKAARRDKEQRMVVPFDVADKDARKENESEMSVSPSISASVSGAVSGTYRQPFTLYVTFETAEGETEDGEEEVKSTVWLAGGTLHRDGQVFQVPDTDKQIELGQATGDGWEYMGEKIKLKWTYLSGEWKYSITQELSENNE